MTPQPTTTVPALDHELADDELDFVVGGLTRALVAPEDDADRQRVRIPGLSVHAGSATVLQP